MTPGSRVTIALALGFAVGTSLAALGGPSADRVTAVVEPVGTLWVNAIRMTVIPLIVSLVVVGIAAADDRRVIGWMSLRALAFFFGTLVAAALVTTVAVPPAFTFLHLDPARVAALRASAVPVQNVPELQTFGEWFVSLVPINPVKAAADGALLPLLVFSVAFGFAVGQISPHERDAVVTMFRGIANAMFVVIRWVLAVAPVGIFALAFVLGARLGSTAVWALGVYVGLAVIFPLAFTIALYPLAAVGGRISIARFARAAAPAQAVAFSSRSSLASLPAMIAGAERELRLPREVSGFVLPLAVSTYRLNAPVSWPVMAMFVARLYGVEFGWAQVAAFAAAGVVLTTSSPGIPSGAVIAQVPLFAAFGLPIEGIGILMAVDAIPDMFKTALNVTADMAAAAVVGRTAAVPARGSLQPLASSL